MVADQQDPSISPPQDQCTPFELEKMLHTHIMDYVNKNSFVKLEASLTEMVYQQFKGHYYSVDDTQKEQIEAEIEQYIPDRTMIKQYIAGSSLSIQKINTIANFFGLNYSLTNHDPVTLYQQKRQV